MLAFIPLSPPREICVRLAQWDGGGFGCCLNRPMGLAWNDGFLYVADAENGAVKKLLDDGSFVAEWKGFKRPVAVAAAEDAVYVADFLADEIVKLNAQNGTAVARWGQHGNGTGEFDAPSGIAVDARGFVYVTEFYNHRVQKLTSNGAFVSQWGTNGRWSGQFHYPTDIAAGPTGELMVADAYNNRIEVFTADGRYLRKWGRIGYGVAGKWGGWFRLEGGGRRCQRGRIRSRGRWNSKRAPAHMRRGRGTGGRKPPRLGCPSGASSDWRTVGRK
jgi:DNA-binding beta-propeller fold protein YncE